MKLLSLVSAGILGAVFSATAISSVSQAALRPDKVHATDAKKTKDYIRDGMFVGGDRAIDDVIVKDIRRASNHEFERLVIDLDVNRAGDKPAVSRPPYYQVAVSADESRVVVTIWGKPKLAFQAPKVLALLNKSPNLGPYELFPRLDDDSWTFVIGLKGPNKSVEVFDLSNPVRIILDIKTVAKKTVE